MHRVAIRVRRDGIEANRLARARGDARLSRIVTRGSWLAPAYVGVTDHLMRAANSFCAAGAKFGLGDGGRVAAGSLPAAEARSEAFQESLVREGGSPARCAAPGSGRIHDDAPRPTAGRLVPVSAQSVADQVEEGEGVALAEELALGRGGSQTT